jgi:aryl-alcohol dehydrogenase-like predicted oxidoreductase
MKLRYAVLACLAFALLAGFLISGHYLYKIPIGLDSSAFLFGSALNSVVGVFKPDAHGSLVGGLWLVISLLAITTLSVVLFRRLTHEQAKASVASRRRFLLGATAVGFGSLLAGVAAAVGRGLFGIGEGGRGWAGIGSSIQTQVVRTHPEWKDAWKGSQVSAYRRLGRTGFEVSDIVLGTGRIQGEDGEKIARLAIDRGINYFDTSPDYSGANSEQAMGRAIRGVRDKLFIATKFCTPEGHLPPGTPVAKYKAAVEGSLQRLGTDYVDLCHIHSCDEVDRLLDPNVHEAFDQLKQEGKVRFLGFSTHTPKLIEVANAGVDDGRFDVMMLAYHFGQWQPLGEIIHRGRTEQDMGVVAMKTLKGAKHHGLEGFREHSDAFSQAALKWTLSNPDVSCAVISFFELQHVDEYLYASGSGLVPADVAILEEYDRQIRGSYCEPTCGVCLDSCPEGLRVDDVLRHRMYFEDYGWEKQAMIQYSKLAKNASVCLSCSAPCAGTCPSGIDIQARTLGAHDLLTLS